MRRIFSILVFGCLYFGVRCSPLDSVRIEPPHWWVGMKSNKLQLLIHGDSISKQSIKIIKTGVTVKKISKAESPNYVFIDLDISPLTKPGDIAIQFGSKKINYSLLPREKNSAQRKGYDNSDVIYLITPDRFANGDSTNDNQPSMIEHSNRLHKDGRHGGDIKGMVDHLDYIQDMGFTALWPTPVLENNLPTFTYHGYAISDFYKVDPRFGTNESYRELANQAKDKGIKLIIDIVVNHCGSGHWWMKDLPFKDWINNEGKFISTNHRRETNMDPHAASYDKQLMTQGWFVPSMPDLNSRNPYMASYLIQNTIWWIEYASLSGLRIDTYPYVDKEFSAKWSKAVLEEYPNLNLVGEEWSYNPMITSYWQKGMKNKDGYISSLRSVMDFPLQNAIVHSLSDKDSGFEKGWFNTYSVLANDFIYADPDNLVVFADNHDMIRFYTQIHENFDWWKQGMVYLTTTRGIPEIYYGTEILTVTASGRKDDGEIRADMPGGWTGDKKNAFTKEGLNAKELEAQSLLRQLLNLRKSAPALQSGRLIQFAPDHGVYTYFRLSTMEKYMIILSKNSTSVKLDPSKFKEIIGSSTEFSDALTHEVMEQDQAFTITPNGYRILKIK
ncbi:MAG: glycoside hydrolase family 13 protein [Saprospiraceae bacterium]